MERINFHTTNYGWNHFAEKASTGKIRVGRYRTNGAENSKENRCNWFKGEMPKSVDECREMVEERFYKEGRH